MNKNLQFFKFLLTFILFIFLLNVSLLLITHISSVYKSIFIFQCVFFSTFNRLNFAVINIVRLSIFFVIYMYTYRRIIIFFIYV